MSTHAATAAHLVSCPLPPPSHLYPSLPLPGRPAACPLHSLIPARPAAPLPGPRRYGFQPQRVAVWIYWQAVRLAFKGCPFYPKPSAASYQQGAARAAPSHPREAATGRWFVWRPTVWPWDLE